MKKYFFNVFAAGMLAAQVVGLGFNEDDALMDACLSMHDSSIPEDDIEEVLLDHIEFINHD